MLFIDNQIHSIFRHVYPLSVTSRSVSLRTHVLTTSDVQSGDGRHFTYSQQVTYTVVTTDTSLTHVLTSDVQSGDGRSFSLFAHQGSSGKSYDSKTFYATLVVISCSTQGSRWYGGREDPRCCRQR